MRRENFRFRNGKYINTMLNVMLSNFIDKDSFE